MAIDQTKIHAGVGNLYYASYGTTFPTTLTSALTWSGWSEIGATKGGLTIEIGTEYASHEVDQKNMPIGHDIVRQTGRIRVTLAETDVDRLRLVIPNAVKSLTAAGVGQVALSTLKVGPGTAHTVYSMGFETEAPAPVGSSYWRMFKFWRVIAAGTIGLAYRKGEITVCDVEFQIEEDTTQNADTSVFAMVDMTGPAS